MNYLLDTSVWLRGALFGETLPEAVRDILDDSNLVLAMSVYSLWEAAKKHQKGKLPLPIDLAEWLKSSVPENFQILPLTPEIIIESTRLPDFPVNDPGDELIVATARIHRLTLLTTDTKLKGYRHARIRYFTPVAEKFRK
ncbi:MAG TPA: type II toxin-antitoxin system VapC family toxin [Verrucomicrobiae bacterium]